MHAQHCRHPSGDKVLVHSAAGGVGLAALQIAQQAGAEVYATAGNDEKRDYVRSLGVEHVFDSRTFDSPTRSCELPRGRGVDIVLNALAGEYVPKNLAALAEGGRFVEIGKSDIWNAERVAGVRPDVHYTVMALDEMSFKTPRTTSAR